MLDTETRRRIDTARDILVGKVPDPKSQVEQITIALIYKFMDDMDLGAEELGGRRKFFTGDFERYGWAKLMRSGLGGHETLNTYAEAIQRMGENPGVPPLFRDIFKNAFLPYRDPETLRAFLKIIDEFEYDHSERLGDAFEYLLSVLGSQGDAGQFRTPRHIIDFIVSIVDPKKNETVLDPACGTAGFLISAYKHILRANSSPDAIAENGGNGEAALHTSKIPAAKGDLLSPDERKKLAENFRGYDISPDMVRLSLVNMYLHGFTDPRIFEYDTLTSQDKWNEYADVVLANPPFMSPKGGIRPHNRFSVQSKRSEVLFVDYMAEHLTPGGRAGIIVPEGIIFQSQNAYKQLRKMLVEEYLVAVVSLPAGVFQPYSGVKTSILILDKSLAKQSDTVGFFKVEHDGFGLGAQRRPIEKNDLPDILAAVKEYMNMDRQDAQDKDKTSCPSCSSMFDSLVSRGLALIVEKERIAESGGGDYNLSGERYRESAARLSSFPSVPVREVFQKSDESVIPGTLDGPVNYIGLENITQGTGEVTGNLVTDDPSEIKSTKNVFRPDDILYGKLRPNLNKVWLADREGICSTDIFVIRPTDGRAIPALFAYLFRSDYFNNAVMSQLKGAQLPRIGWKSFEAIEIPLPPLEVQKEIVAEIEGYQKVIDGARAVLDHYRPHIPINPDWPVVELGKVCELARGGSPRPIHKYVTNDPNGVNWVKIGDAPSNGIYITGTKERITQQGATKSRVVRPGDLILSNSMSVGRPYIMATDGFIHDGWILMKPDTGQAAPEYLVYALSDPAIKSQFVSLATGGVVNNLNLARVAGVSIPLPPLETQQQIVAEIEAEQRLVESNRQLIARMERKIQLTIARIWGEEPEETRESVTRSESKEVSIGTA